MIALRHRQSGAEIRVANKEQAEVWRALGYVDPEPETKPASKAKAPRKNTK